MTRVDSGLAPVVLLGLLVVACGGSDEDDSSGKPPATASSSAASTGASGGAGGSAGEGGVGGAGGQGGISVGATRGTLSLPFSVDAEGVGASKLGAIHVAGAKGTIEIGGEALEAIAYERQPFAPYLLYQMLVVDDDRVFVVWLYCQDADLVGAYFEGTDGTELSYEATNGTCTDIATPTDVEVALPSVAMEYPALLEGYTLDGPYVHYDGVTPGSLDLGSGPLVLLPFEDVDCSTCGGAGWFEIHTLIWDPASQRFCFAIFYLFEPGDPVQLQYSLTLPDLSDPVGNTELDATWTAPF